MSEKAVTVKSERNAQSRDPEKRSRLFTSVLLTALFGVPLACIFFRLFPLVEPGLLWPTMYLTLFIFGGVLPAVAIGVGHRVSKRVPFVVWHVAITLHLFGVAISISVLPGWDDAGPTHRLVPDFVERVWLGFLDLVTFPAWMVLVYYVLALGVALSWLIYRIDAFRAATGNDDSSDGLAKLIGWPKGAKVRSETIEGDEFAVTAKIDNPGVPISELRNKLPALEEHPGIIRGRSSIVGDAQGGSATIRLVHTDPHSQWRVWPGLSHPGGSYTDPIRTSYYSTGETQWYSFVKTPQGYKSEKVPGFVNRNDTFHGTQGATGTGKSGDSAIENAEVLSRRNVQLIYIDTAKLLQNAGWCLDLCSLAAGSVAANGALWTALRRLGEYRSRVLGDAGHRNFTDAAYDELGLSWIHIFADEFDVAKHGSAVEWLATKGRSLGFRLSFTLPRATAKAMDADVRGAVGMWSQFGITQDYDKGYALSEETILAGANPEGFGVGTPGVHYLDGSPAIDKSMYPIDCRTYQTREDFGDLRRAVEAARATFTPATFTPGELEVLGDIVKICSPSAVRGGKLGQDDDEPGTGPIYTPASRGSAPTSEGTDMQQTIDLDDFDEFDDDLVDGPIPPIDTSEIEREYGPIDSREPIPQTAAGEPADMALDPDPAKPRVSPEQAVAEFEAALIRMANRGVREFGGADVRKEMLVDMSPPRVSERFTALTQDESLNPPGLKIERLGRGRFLFVRLSEHGRDGR